MYVTPNYPSKKALKDAVALYQAWLNRPKHAPLTVGAVLEPPMKEPPAPRVFSPGPFPANENGIEFVEGPHYPKPHRWYARVQVVDGLVTKVLS